MIVRRVFPGFMFLVALSLVFGLQQLPIKEGPQNWAVIHPLDVLAARRICEADSLAKASRVAADLGYEPVVDGSIAFFFPVPVWSADVGTELEKLLRDTELLEHGRAYSANELNDGVRVHLDRFLRRYAAKQVGGALGGSIKQSGLTNIRIARSIDLTITSNGTNRTMGIPVHELAKWCECEPVLGKEVPRSQVSFAERKELYGLGTVSFSLSMNRQVDQASFEKLLDRAKLLLRQRREDSVKRVRLYCADAIARALSSKEALRLLSGEAKQFSDLPSGLKDWLTKVVSDEPGFLAHANAAGATSMLGLATFTLPKSGWRTFIEFELQERGVASDGSQVTYRVAFEATEIAERGY